MRRIAIWAGALILGGAALAAYHYHDAARPWVEANLPVWLGGARAAHFIIVSGNIEAHESVVSFRSVQSRIIELPFDEGARVKAGTLLARVDDADYKQQVVIAQANLNAQMKQLDVAEQNVEATRKTVTSDEADVALKQLEYTRAQTLLTKGAGTVDARDIAQTAYKQSAAALERDKALEASADRSVALAIANIESARAALKMAQITLGYTTLKAPFDGVILVRQAELGEVVSPGAAIVTLADIGHVWLRAYVNEPDIGKIRLGERATVTTDSYPGKEYPGRISCEWERGTMEVLVSTPVTRSELMVGKIAPYVLIGMLDAAFCLAIAVFWFAAPFRGGVFTLFVTTLLFLIVVLGVGYFISASIRSQIGASQIALLVTMLPTTLLSGFAFPIDQMPPPVQWVTYLVHSRYYMTILKAIFLKGSGLGDLIAPIAALTIYAIVIGILATRAFRKTLG